jgi:hypothetical protein
MLTGMQDNGHTRLKMMLLSVAQDARTLPPPQNFTAGKLLVRRRVTMRNSVFEHLL